MSRATPWCDMRLRDYYAADDAAAMRDAAATLPLMLLLPRCCHDIEDMPMLPAMLAMLLLLMFAFYALCHDAMLCDAADDIFADYFLPMAITLRRNITLMPDAAISIFSDISLMFRPPRAFAAIFMPSMPPILLPFLRWLFRLMIISFSSFFTRFAYHAFADIITPLLMPALMLPLLML